MLTLLLRYRTSQIGLTSFNENGRLLMSHPQKRNYFALANSRLKVRERPEVEGISKYRIGHIRHKILGIRKLSAPWVHCLINPYKMHICNTAPQQCLTLFKHNTKEFRYTGPQITVETVKCLRLFSSEKII